VDAQQIARRRSRRRPLPEDRLEDLIRAAAAVFSRRGYRRTQMAEVARELGVSPGNLYNYVEGKDALFHLVLRRGLGERPGEQPPQLPVTGASVEVTADWVARRLDFVSDFPELEAAFARTQPPDPRAELEAVVGELYDVLVGLRLGADVLERSIEDVPELARIFAGRRRELFVRYERYLRQRAGEGAILVEHPQAVAHLIVELCSWAARRRPHDPDATQISDAVARQAVCRFAANALLAPFGPGPAAVDRGKQDDSDAPAQPSAP
jgi:AcrR family transcriptional regulator